MKKQAGYYIGSENHIHENYELTFKLLFPIHLSGGHQILLNLAIRTTYFYHLVFLKANSWSFFFKFLSLGMTIKIGKKESLKKVAGKLTKITSKSKKIDWNKYFGKIEFPVNALTYQRKLRDEWAR